VWGGVSGAAANTGGNASACTAKRRSGAVASSPVSGEPDARSASREPPGVTSAPWNVDGAPWRATPVGPTQARKPRTPHPAPRSGRQPWSCREPLRPAPGYPFEGRAVPPELGRRHPAESTADCASSIDRQALVSSLTMDRERPIDRLAIVSGATMPRRALRDRAPCFDRQAIVSPLTMDRERPIDRLAIVSGATMPRQALHDRARCIDRQALVSPLTMDRECTFDRLAIVQGPTMRWQASQSRLDPTRAADQPLSSRAARPARSAWPRRT